MEHPPSGSPRPHRGRGAETPSPRASSPALLSCAPAQNTCHDLKWCTKNLSYLPVIEPQGQNPSCRTLVFTQVRRAFTCAGARCPPTARSHDLGPPYQQAGTMNPPKIPSPNDPMLCPSGANTLHPIAPPKPVVLLLHPTPPHRTSTMCPITTPHLTSRIHDLPTYPHRNLLPQTTRNEPVPPPTPSRSTSKF